MLFTNAPNWYYYWEIPLVLFGLLFYILFLQHFLANAFQTPFFNKVIDYFKYAIPGLCMGNLILIDWYGFDLPWEIYEYSRIALLLLFILMIYHILKHNNRSELSIYIFSGTFILLLFTALTMGLSTSPTVLKFFGFDQHFIGPWDIPLLPVQIGILIEILFFSIGLSVKSKLSLKNKNRLLVENEILQKEANQKLELGLRLEKEASEKSAIKKSLIQAELKTLRAQLKPHFIYNCFSAILNFMEKQEYDQAINYLKQFSELMGYVLDLSEESSISLETEVDAIKNYVNLEQMRFPNKFTFTLHIDEEINIKEIQLPPLITQPFVENAIKHGLLLKESDQILLLSIKRQEEFVVLSIEDNGVGRNFKKAKKIERNGGRGIKISTDRIHLFNQKYNSNIQMDINDKFDVNGESMGTSILFKFPLIK